jgi:DNA-binding PadR family transcriptional regulator
MFPRKTLDLVILSILDKEPDGLTGYELVKQIKHKFGKISPGTVYPRLKKNKALGDISDVDEENHFKITEQGQQKLQANIPNVMNKNLEFFPNLYKILVKSLPIPRQVDYMGFSPNFDIFEDFSHWDDYIKNYGFNKSLETLKKLKMRLEKTKNKIEDQIKKVDEKIRSINEEKKEWTKIPISDGDS